MALLGNSAWSVIAILPRGFPVSGLSEAFPVRVCGVALLFYCSPPMCARTHIFQRIGATFQPSRSKRTYQAHRLLPFVCIRRHVSEMPLPGSSATLTVQEIGGATRDLAVSSIRTRS